MDPSTLATITIVVSILSSMLSSGVIVFILESRKEDKKAHNEKVEELYLAIHKWSKLAEMNWMAQAQWMSGKITINDMNELMLSHKDPQLPFERINVLVDVYFPSVKERISAMRNTMDQAGKVYHVVRRIAEERQLDGTEVERFLKATEGFEEVTKSAQDKVISLQR